MTKHEANDSVISAAGTTTVGVLRERIRLLEDGIVLHREPPKSNADVYQVLIERSLELGAQFERFVLIMDLSDASERPRGRYLELIRRGLLEKLGTPGAPIAVVCIPPRSVLLKTVLSFIIGRMSPRLSVQPTLEAALAAGREALAADDRG